VYLWTLTAALALAQSGLERDGAYFVRSAHTEPARISSQAKRVELYTRGHVVLRGSDDAAVEVRLRQRVRAASAEEASRALGPVGRLGPVVSIGGVVRLELHPPGDLRVINELEVTLPRALSQVLVKNQAGGVEVYDLDGRLEVATGGGPLTLDRIRGPVRVHTGLGNIRLGVVGGTVECSSGGGAIVIEQVAGDLNCQTGGGNVTVKYAGSAVTVATEGGNIRVERAGGEVRARSAAGVIEVVEAQGAVFADTRGGSIHVGEASGVRAESGAGTIRVKGGSGPLTVSTALGNILAELRAGGRMAASSLAASSGDITVMIPAGLGLTVRARNDSGVTPRIVSDFPEIQVRSIGFQGPGALGQGALHGGGPVLELSTNSGVIYLRRTK
jgi:DUF4097 and DUF4098 domain-containing protein YvlB